MTEEQIQLMLYTELGLAKSTEYDSLISELIKSVALDIMVVAEYGLLIVNSTLNTVSGQDYALLPTDFSKLARLWKYGRDIVELKYPYEYYGKRKANNTNGEPVWCMVMGRDANNRRKVFFEPVPDGIYPYTLSYYSTPKQLTIGSIPEEWHLTILKGIKPYLIADTPGNEGKRAMAIAEYNADLVKLLSFENRKGDAINRGGVDPAVKIKNRYTFPGGGGAGSQSLNAPFGR